ncbi:hypothetical protein LAUMK41_04498 [Mycobacterium attenuatum]|nr:hypothetical protein LAUMK41_04498 [Mycobacterium attenuatum]
MPRGGPDASWLDRRLQTDGLEYTDRYDVSDETKQYVVTALARIFRGIPVSLGVDTRKCLSYKE